MDLKNKRVEIKVSEPFSWPFGKLFGEVFSIENSTNIIVKLDVQIREGDFKSNWALLTIRHVGFTFDKFDEGCMWVNGKIISEEGKAKQFPFIAEVCIA